MNVHGGVVDMGASLVRMGWRPLGLLVPLPPLPPPAPQKSRRMMAYNNIDFGFNPVGAPTCLHKHEVGKPSRNAAQPYAKAEGCVHDDPQCKMMLCLTASMYNLTSGDNTRSLRKIVFCKFASIAMSRL